MKISESLYNFLEDMEKRGLLAYQTRRWTGMESRPKDEDGKIHHARLGLENLHREKTNTSDMAEVLIEDLVQYLFETQKAMVRPYGLWPDSVGDKIHLFQNKNLVAHLKSSLTDYIARRTVETFINHMWQDYGCLLDDDHATEMFLRYPTIKQAEANS